MSAIYTNTIAKSCETMQSSQMTHSNQMTYAALISPELLAQETQSLQGRVSVLGKEEVTFEIDLSVDMENASVSRNIKISAPTNSPELAPQVSGEVEEITIN